MRTNLNKSIGTLLLAGLLTLPTLLPAQPTAHYVPGSEGIKAATLPPPGFWLRDSTRLNDPQGHEIAAAAPNALVYANVPRLLWISDVKLLDGYLGVDALLPLVYTRFQGNLPPPWAGPFDGHTFDIGDVFFEGTWSWHPKQFDLALGAGAWAPTGKFDMLNATQPNPTSPGKGYWSEMLTAGATWYPEENKRWSVSVLNRYEFNQKQDYTDNTIGQAYTVEGGLSFAVAKTVDVGVVGYYQQLVTGNRGPTGPQQGHNRVAAVGPEAGIFFPSAMLGLSLRYEYEFMAQNRLQGHTVTLTLTKKL
jgi:hypothetical protein